MPTSREYRADGRRAIWKRVSWCESKNCSRAINRAHILDHLPEGELQTRVPRRIKEGETISRVEAPRGELFYFIRSNGTDTPERIKVRTPTMCNMASVLALAIGLQLADMPMILIGVDPCFSCNDRSVVIRQGEAGDSWTWERLRQYGTDFYRRQR
jgi:NADH-quinone oxidoreductase subunit D